MARKAAWEDLVEADVGPYGKARGTRWGGVLVGLLLIATATFVLAYYLPLYRAHRKLAEQQRELGQRAQTVADQLSRSERELAAVTTRKNELQAQQELRDSAQKKMSDQRERTRATLAAKLDKFSKKGLVAVLVSGGSLSVAIDGALVFAPQKVEVTPAARALLCEVAKTSAAKSIAVRDSLAGALPVPPALAASYPSPWALSAARAAAVAQALHDVCSFADTELTVIGNGNHDPSPAELASSKFAGDRLDLVLTLP